MSARKKCKIKALTALIGFLPCIVLSAVNTETLPHQSLAPLTGDTLAEQLGWVHSADNVCGGYYLEAPFFYEPNENVIKTSGNQALFSLRGTSMFEGGIVINRSGQQITANKAYLYRDPETNKLNYIDMLGDVHLREPYVLIIAKEGHYNFKSKAKKLMHILYRTSLERQKPLASAGGSSIEQPHKITALTAWGKADQFEQSEPEVYSFSDASYSTCPPLHPAWRVKASHIVLNKNTGRGYATHARIFVKEVPIFYAPYFNFPIDNRRQTGFLWPSYGGANSTGPAVYAPFYWNMAPNYDMTITPALLTKRGLLLSDRFRYLTSTSTGEFDINVLPNDKAFEKFQQTQPQPPKNQDPNVTDAEQNRLNNASATRKSFIWRNHSQFNEYWSDHIDFNYAGDDYYMRDLGSNLNEITSNQLLQEADLYYKSPNWNFTGRVQTYQTLHPVDSPIVYNAYRRLPQLILNGDYPDQALGLDYFVSSEVTHFEILNNPGINTSPPIGNRLHVQPGINLPLIWPYLYINPRLQLALTDYNLYHTTQTQTPNAKHRAVPIFDLMTKVQLERDASLFNHGYRQTLEPQIYYTYIPYRNQASIPTFDTTVNTLVYDQIFNYNRFSGLDRIGDANQIGVGITTRLIDQESGFEKIRLGVGEIIYFSNRLVTLCNDDSCVDNPSNPNNYRRLSPISGMLNYNINPIWSFNANLIWNPISKQVDNTTLSLHYQPDDFHIFNLGYNYVHSGDVLAGSSTISPANNLKVTDASFAWPVSHAVSLVGRWTQDWLQNHFQNLLYGLQYDTCCWAMQLVGQRTFTNLVNNKPQYNNGIYIQFALKGLGNIGSGNSGLLSGISGYKTQLGQEF